MRRGILALQGAVISRVSKPPCKKRPIQIQPGIRAINGRLAGKRLDSIDRWGKRLILRSGEHRLVIEPRMTGNILISDPPTSEHLRLRIEFKSKDTDILFWDRRGLGTVTLYNQKQFDTRFGDGQLGPDALTIKLSELQSNLQQRKIEVKVGLLDQKAVAGIGNIYASEILFLAGIDPRARCSRITKPQWERIHHQTGIVLEQAIQHEGSTLGDGTYQTAVNEPGRYQNQHRVYDREDELCELCRSTKIRRIVQAQRSTYYCPGCQKKTDR